MTTRAARSAATPGLPHRYLTLGPERSYCMDMPNTNTAAIESLRRFAYTAMRATVHTPEEMRDHKHIVAFAYMCTAAIAGEEWAVERLQRVLDLEEGINGDGSVTDLSSIILATDVTRPDGAIARQIEGV